jgi:hypothetical protein
MFAKTRDSLTISYRDNPRTPGIPSRKCVPHAFEFAHKLLFLPLLILARLGGLGIFWTSLSTLCLPFILIVGSGGSGPDGGGYGGVLLPGVPERPTKASSGDAKGSRGDGTRPGGFEKRGAGSAKGFSDICTIRGSKARPTVILRFLIYFLEMKKARQRIANEPTDYSVSLIKYCA